jgi:cation:H+ antiporter
VNPYFSLLIGVACAGVGGELFVRGLVGFARWARISAVIIGTTIAAFATSSPELSVAIGAAVSGKPEISLGDALGSNVVNVALILALALCVSAIQSPRSSVKRDFPVALLVPVVVGVLAFDGGLSRVDGVILMALFFTWLVLVIRQARQERTSSEPSATRTRLGPAVALALGGLVFLIGSGHFIVAGARGIATAFGIPEFVIGATVVAVGTSMPELATTLISKLRGHDEIGLGTILGSNVFNGLFIVGLAAVICPIQVQRAAVGATLVFGVVTTAVTFPNRRGLIGRSRGLALLAIYAGYVAFLLKQ